MKIKKLGVVEEINIQFKDLLIFTGNNNSGKTYVSYLLYGIISALREDYQFNYIESDYLKEILENPLSLSEPLRIEKKNIEQKYVAGAKKFLESNLKDIAVKNFKIKESNFSDLSIQISDEEISKIIGEFFNFSKKNLKFQGFEILINNNDTDAFISIIFKVNQEKNLLVEDDKDNFYTFLAKKISDELIELPKVFYFPAERNGINVFKNELNERRLKTYDTLLNTLQFANLTNKAEKQKMRNQLFTENIELLMEGSGNSPYPKPISDYINFLNNMKNQHDDIKNNKNEVAQYIRDEILGGRYEIDENDNSIYFRQRYGKVRYRSETIPFHVVSSSIKSLYGLDYYIEFLSNEYDYIIIDEPELSLHPLNQVKLAKVLSKLIDSGVKVIISTHSDLLIREMNNIIIENKLDNKTGVRNENTGLYQFRYNSVKEESLLTEMNYFNNFDDAVLEVQDRYNDLLERLDEWNESNDGA